MTTSYTPTDGALGTSDFAASVACLGRRNACMGLPGDDKPNAARDRGSRIHYAHETESDDGLETWDEVDAFERDNEIEARILAILEQTGLRGAELIREEPIRLRDHLPGDWLLETRGLDRLYIYGDVGLYIDYKLGREPVAPAQRNLQGMMGCILAAWKHSLSDVYVAFIQQEIGGPGFTITKYDTAKILEATEYYKKIDALVRDPNAKRTPSRDACLWCRACGNPDRCWEGMAFAHRLAKAASDPLFLKSAAELTPDDRALLLDDFDLVATAQKRYKEWVKAGITADPGFATGWKIGAGAKRSTVTRTGEAHLLLKEAGLLTDTELWECTKMSLSDVVDAVRDRVAAGGGKMSDGEAKMRVAQTIGPLVEYKEGETKLMRERKAKAQ